MAANSGPMRAIITPKLGMNWSTAPSTAHSGAQGTPMMERPMNHKPPTISAFHERATSQAFSAPKTSEMWFCGLTQDLDAHNRHIPSCYSVAMKFGVIVFPGSNCDHDAYYA